MCVCQTPHGHRTQSEDQHSLSMVAARDQTASTPTHADTAHHSTTAPNRITLSLPQLCHLSAPRDVTMHLLPARLTSTHTDHSSHPLTQDGIIKTPECQPTRETRRFSSVESVSQSSTYRPTHRPTHTYTQTHTHTHRQTSSTQRPSLVVKPASQPSRPLSLLCAHPSLSPPRPQGTGRPQHSCVSVCVVGHMDKMRVCPCTHLPTPSVGISVAARQPQSTNAAHGLILCR